jgi:DNA ligase-4
VLFRASYGPTREQLEVYNENLRLGRWPSKPFDRDDPFKRVCRTVQSWWGGGMLMRLRSAADRSVLDI